MSAGKRTTPWSLKWELSPRTACLLIVLVVFGGTFALRHMGLLQFLEFYAYDFLVLQQPRAETSDPIVIVEMTETDIHSPKLDYPIHDDKLADLLLALEAAQPAVIGLDIWRDIPVPKSGVGIHKFNEVLQSYSNIVAIFTRRDDERAPISPPSILRSNIDRIAFNDNFVMDAQVDPTTPKTRRTVLFLNSTEGGNFDSLPLRLALIYLEKKGIGMEPDPENPKGFRLGKSRIQPLEPNDGAYVAASTVGEFQILLDFKCPDGFLRYSVSEVFSGRIPPERFRDKIILIGMNTPSVLDERVTPFRRNHLGVEVQALTINQLLRHALEGEKQLQSWEDWIEDAWLLLWCIVGGALGYWVHTPLRFTLTALCCLLALAGTAWMAFSAGWWIPVVTPAAGCVPAAVLAISYVSAQQRSMRGVLMKLYSRHVSKEIAEAIWENRDSFMDGQRPLAQKLVVTVLFTDLKGFSTIAEKMQPAQLYVWLNGYLGAMAQVIQNHGGVLKQFTGDGILALFGVPVPHLTREQQATDAAAAVNCALGLGRRLVELRKEWEGAGLPPVSMRVGIYTGEVAAGSVGSDDRFEYAVIGDAVNTAARLEAYDKSLADPDLLPNRCRILVGAPTHDLLDGQFVSQEIGLLQVKGKVNKVAVFQILDETRASAPVNAEPAIAAMN